MVTKPQTRLGTIAEQRRDTLLGAIRSGSISDRDAALEMTEVLNRIAEPFMARPGRDSPDSEFQYKNLNRRAKLARTTLRRLARFQAGHKGNNVHLTETKTVLWNEICVAWLTTNSAEVRLLMQTELVSADVRRVTGEQAAFEAVIREHLSGSRIIDNSKLTDHFESLFKAAQAIGNDFIITLVAEYQAHRAKKRHSRNCLI